MDTQLSAVISPPPSHHHRCCCSEIPAVAPTLLIDKTQRPESENEMRKNRSSGKNSRNSSSQVLLFTIFAQIIPSYNSKITLQRLTVLANSSSRRTLSKTHTHKAVASLSKNNNGVPSLLHSRILCVTMCVCAFAQSSPNFPARSVLWARLRWRPVRRQRNRAREREREAQAAH